MRDYEAMILFSSALLIIGIILIVIGTEIPVIKTNNGFIITNESIWITGVGAIILIGSLVSFTKSTQYNITNSSSQESAKEEGDSIG